MNYKEQITVHHVSEKNVVADLHLYCGRGTPALWQIKAGLGNPHWMKEESKRDEVCIAYANDLLNQAHPHWNKIKRIAHHLREDRKVALYCHCAPKRCHCDTIKDLSIQIANID